jgi:hypothetical protein
MFTCTHSALFTSGFTCLCPQTFIIYSKNLQILSFLFWNKSCPNLNEVKQEKFSLVPGRVSLYSIQSFKWLKDDHWHQGKQYSLLSLPT